MKSVATLFALLLIAARVSADDVSVEERLRRLEAEVAQLKADNAELRRALSMREVEAAPPVVAAPPQPQPQKVVFGGLLQAQAESGDRGDSRFSDDHPRLFIRRARVNVTGETVAHLSFRAEMELAGSVGNAALLRAQLTDAWLGWSRSPSLSLRAGQFKTPFGFEQLQSDQGLETIERSLATERLTSGRQVGLQLGGSPAQRVSYAIGAFNGTGTNLNFNDNGSFLVAARLSAVPVESHGVRWSLGANALRGEDDGVAVAPDFLLDSTPSSPAYDNLFAGSRRGIAFDTQLELQRCSIRGEWLRERFAPDGGAAPFDAEGWYAQTSVFVVADKLQLVGRLEQFDPFASRTGDATRSFVAGVNWFVHPRAAKLQLDWMRARMPGSAKPQQKFLARVQTVF